jgi:hypothetical protein
MPDQSNAKTPPPPPPPPPPVSVRSLLESDHPKAPQPADTHKSGDHTRG